MESLDVRISKEIEARLTTLEENEDKIFKLLQVFRSLVKHAPQQMSSDCDLIEPTNDCKLCLGPDDKPTFHVFKDGVPIPCECRDRYLDQVKIYKDYVATKERRLKRQESDLRAAAKRAKGQK